MIFPEKEPFVILMADDDEDDTTLVKEALQESGLRSDFRSVPDGAELMDYLHRVGPHANPLAYPCPDLILLDLNMPRKDGREALKEIKSDPSLCTIPVVIFSTSQEKEEIKSCYSAGANSYVVKPVTFEELLLLVKHLEKYWSEIVTRSAEEACG
jgi:CheY-like chemotaxis protein